MIRSVLGSALLIAAICSPSVILGAEASRPNIIVILADDLGYSDVGIQGVAGDVRTPHLDQLAREGIRCTAGYVTAPQCSPSRVGLLTGRYQQRFGIDNNSDTPLPVEAVTIAERLKAAHYVTGHVGKWHLEPNPTSAAWIKQNLPDAKLNAQGRISIPLEIALRYFPEHQGFDQFFTGAAQRYYANYGLTKAEGRRETVSWVDDARFRIDVQTDAAVAFLENQQQAPFFLYLSYYAPHVPLEATAAYLERIPSQKSERRRHALAMMAAIDDGVGRIRKTLASKSLDDNTLIVFASDNGAPLQGQAELPVDVGGATWNGSLNEPWVGEKGMLTEGGIRVPFLVHWKGMLTPGVYQRPVSTLDLSATAIAAAGLPPDRTLDGVDLVPHLTGTKSDDPHPALYWRFWKQAAIRSGKWKYLRAGDRAAYLFDVDSEAHEHKNVIADHPEIAERLRVQLEAWCRELPQPGLPTGDLRRGEDQWYATHLGLTKESANPNPSSKN